MHGCVHGSVGTQGEQLCEFVSRGKSMTFAQSPCNSNAPAVAKARAHFVAIAVRAAAAAVVRARSGAVADKGGAVGAAGTGTGTTANTAAEADAATTAEATAVHRSDAIREFHRNGGILVLLDFVNQRWQPPASTSSALP